MSGSGDSGRKPRGFLNEAVWPNKISVRQDAISDSYAVETRPFARGKFATVRRCRHIESGKDFAAKYLRKRRRAEDVRHELIHEALVLALANECERIVSLKEVFETPSEVILVLEMAAGGELQHVLDSEDCLPEASCRQLLQQISQGLKFLHKNNIAHLDIKPANILLTNAFPQGEARLCDFGISRLILPGEDILEIAGTPDYVAPEVLQYEPISLATDMWSVGILTYVLLTGHTPFGGDTKQDTYCNITLAELDFPRDLFEDVSADAVQFITQLVVKDPRKRLTIDQVLNHPWLTGSSASSPMSISVTSLSEAKQCSLPECETPSTSSMGSCESDNEMDEVKGAINNHQKADEINEIVIETQPSATSIQRDQSPQRIVEVESTDEERNSIIDSASPAPEEELPSLQSSTSSSDSPVPAKKEKECEERQLSKKVSFGSCCTNVKSTSSKRPTTRSSAPSLPITRANALVATRRTSDFFSNKSTTTDRSSSSSLPRSNSVSPVRTMSSSPVAKQSMLTSSKSLSNAISLSNSFKVPTNQNRTTKKPCTSVPNSTSLTAKRSSVSSLKRPQPSSVPKVSKSNQSLSGKSSPAPRASLLSPTVSSTLKSCAIPLRTVNTTQMRNSECDLHRRCSAPTPSINLRSSQEENKSKRYTGTERTMKKPIKSTGSNVSRNGLVENRNKSNTRKSLDIDALRRKTFVDDMLVC